VVISAETPSFTGTTPAGPLKNLQPNQIPGHFFWAVKSNNTLEFWDGQSGGPQAPLPGTWIYRWMIVGNALHP